MPNHKSTHFNTIRSINNDILHKNTMKMNKNNPEKLFDQQDSGSPGQHTRLDFVQIQQRRPRPQTCFCTRRSTKQEEKRVVPKKSSFNCHEKALKEAGFDVITNKPLDQSGHDVSRRESVSSTEGLDPANEPYDEPECYIKIIITDVSDVVVKTEDQITTNNFEQTEKNNNDDAQELYENKHKTVNGANLLKVPIQGSKKKTTPSDETEDIECQPLFMYLEYINENKQEYLRHRETSRIVGLDQPCRESLIKLGRAFEVRNNGGKVNIGKDVTVMAAKTLRPRTADLRKFYRKRDTDRWMLDSGIIKMRSQTEGKRHQDKHTTAAVMMAKDEEYPRTELDKRALKAEEWCRNIQTDVMIKGKVQSLRKLGHEDDEMTNWKEAFKNCQYLRRYLYNVKR